MTRRRFAETAYAARLAEFNGKCACGCGQTVGGANGLIWDHITALELGGADELENLQPLTKRCNKPKTAEDQTRIAKAKRQARRQAGIKRTARRGFATNRDGRWKMRLTADGPKPERRE